MAAVRSSSKAGRKLFPKMFEPLDLGPAGVRSMRLGSEKKLNFIHDFSDLCSQIIKPELLKGFDYR